MRCIDNLSVIPTYWRNLLILKVILWLCFHLLWSEFFHENYKAEIHLWIIPNKDVWLCLFKRLTKVRMYKIHLELELHLIFQTSAHMRFHVYSLCTLRYLFRFSCPVYEKSKMIIYNNLLMYFCQGQNEVQSCFLKKRRSDRRATAARCQMR